MLTPGWGAPGKVAGTPIGPEKLGQPSPCGQQPCGREFPGVIIESSQEVNWSGFAQYFGQWSHFGSRPARAQDTVEERLASQQAVPKKPHQLFQALAQVRLIPALLWSPVTQQHCKQHRLEYV